MDHQSQPDKKRDLAPAAILAILISYGIALCIDWPQSGTEQIVTQQLEHAANHPEFGAAIEIANEKNRKRRIAIDDARVKLVEAEHGPLPAGG